MTEHSDQFDERLDRYLDRELSPQERADFERAAAEDERVRTALALQRHIDAGLRRLFTPPPGAHRARLSESVVVPSSQCEPVPLDGQAPRPHDALPRSANVIARHRPAWMRSLAVAAALAMILVGGWLLWKSAQPGRTAGYGPWRSFAQLHAEAVAGDLDTWRCKDEREFAEIFSRRYGQALGLGALPQGAEALGLVYCHSLSRDTLGVVGRARGRTILILIDRGTNDGPSQRLPRESGLRLFRGRLGGLVLYEITPLEEPVFLPHLRAPAGPGVGEIEEIEP